MSMTTKEYTAIAAIIRKQLYPSIPLKVDKRALLQVTEDLTDYMYETNPRFDRHKFLVACGYY